MASLNTISEIAKGVVVFGPQALGTLAAATAFAIAGGVAALAVTEAGSVQPALVSNRAVVAEGSSDFTPDPATTIVANPSEAPQSGQIANTPIPTRTSDPQASPRNTKAGSTATSLEPVAETSTSNPGATHTSANPKPSKSKKTEDPEDSDDDSDEIDDDGDADD